MTMNLVKNNTARLLLYVSLSYLAACSDQAPSKQLTASDYPEANSEITKLYLEKCGGCHAAPLPNIHAEKQWMGVVQRMQFRMTSKAMQPLRDHELTAIVEYLQKHARKK